MTKAEALQRARAAKSATELPMPDRFWAKVDRRSDHECWPWTAAARKKTQGYGAFWLNRRHHPASRIAWIVTNGDIPSGLLVCHKCDNPPCCNPNHMFLGTPQENDADRVSKGRQVRGSKFAHAVLTEELVITLRKRAAEVGLKAASLEMGINYFTAWDACKRRWRHV